MSKKRKLLALFAIAAAVAAVPAIAPAAELHFEGPTTFTGEGPFSELRAVGEPTYTCEKTDVEPGATIAAGGTTGTMQFDLTGCHISMLGFTVKCRTAGSALDNTIKTGASLHFITTEAEAVKTPSILITISTTSILCAGTEFIYHGSIIGTITSPKCGESSTTMKLSFGANGSAQDHTSYTGKTYNLTATTSNGSSANAALVGSATLNSTAGKLNCT